MNNNKTILIDEGNYSIAEDVFKKMQKMFQKKSFEFNKEGLQLYKSAIKFIVSGAVLLEEVDKTIRKVK